jgi:hypothetical protein
MDSSCSSACTTLVAVTVASVQHSVVIAVCAVIAGCKQHSSSSSVT